MNRSLISQHLLAQCFGAIGSVVISGNTGSICCAHKPFCSPLARFSTWWQSRLKHHTCKPERSGLIGGSVGSNVLPAMLALFPPHHLRSLSMASQSSLLTSLALMC